MSKLETVLAARARELASKVAKVGWFETAVYPDGKPVAEVAMIHEHGAPGAKIPARPFFKPVISENKEAWKANLASGVRAVMAGKIDADSMFEQIGALAAGQVRAKLASGDFLKLSPITLMLRKWKDADPGLKIGGRMVGAAAASVAAGDDYSLSGMRNQPLHDTGYMISTLTNIVAGRDK